MVINEYRGIAAYDSQDDIEKLYIDVLNAYNNSISDTFTVHCHTISWCNDCIVNCHKNSKNSSFQPMLSDYKTWTPNGKAKKIVFNIGLIDFSKQSFNASIYHEFNHAYEEWDSTKQKNKISLSNRSTINRDDILQGDKGKFEYSVIGNYKFLMYRLIDTEINALASQIYGELKGMDSQSTSDIKKSQSWIYYEYIKRYYNVVRKANDSEWNDIINYNIKNRIKNNKLNSKGKILSYIDRKIEKLRQKLIRSAETYYTTLKNGKMNEGVNCNITKDTIEKKDGRAKTKKLYISEQQVLLMKEHLLMKDIEGLLKEQYGYCDNNLIEHMLTELEDRMLMNNQIYRLMEKEGILKQTPHEISDSNSQYWYVDGEDGTYKIRYANHWSNYVVPNYTLDQYNFMKLYGFKTAPFPFELSWGTNYGIDNKHWNLIIDESTKKGRNIISELHRVENDMFKNMNIKTNAGRGDKISRQGVIYTSQTGSGKKQLVYPVNTLGLENKVFMLAKAKISNKKVAADIIRKIKLRTEPDTQPDTI